LADNILTVMRDRIRSAMNDVADYVATGGCLSHEDPGAVAMDYAKNAGKIEGLALAERALLDILEEIEKREKLDV
jgi:hypothetical protein